MILQKHEKFFSTQNITTIKFNVVKESIYLQVPRNFISWLTGQKAYVKILE